MGRLTERAGMRHYLPAFMRAVQGIRDGRIEENRSLASRSAARVGINRPAGPTGQDAPV